MSAPPAHLYWTTVRHRRIGRVKHKLEYSVFATLFDVDRLDDPELPSLFSHNSWNLFSLFDRDHGAKRAGVTPRDWIAKELRNAGADFEIGQVRLLCFPRVLGYVFNPLSVWFIADASGAPRATLYEVRNTFGEWHNYLFWSKSPLDARHGSAKRFYVSPFLDMMGGYRFLTEHPPLDPQPHDRLTVAINRSDAEGPVLHAVQTGTPEPLTNRAILRAMVTRPLMTLKVVVGIHVEALQLLVKGAKFHHRPRTYEAGKPAKETTAIEVGEWTKTSNPLPPPAQLPMATSVTTAIEQATLA